MILQRVDFLEFGIFGTLRTDDDTEICKTLEHAYPSGSGFKPKLPSGNYACARGLHRLGHGMLIETFEVLGVPGHTGIVLHTGNFNKDSDGCILVGKSVELEKKMLSQSINAFLDLMGLLRGVKAFELVVV